MGLLRFLAIAVLVAVALMLLKRLFMSRKPTATPRTPAPKLVQCAYCGVHVSESEAVRSGDRFFCSVEHQRIAP